MPGSSAEMNIREKRALPPVSVATDTPAGTCTPCPAEAASQAQQLGTPAPDDTPESSNARPLGALPPLSPVHRGAAAIVPPQDLDLSGEEPKSDEAVLRHGHILEQMETVIQKHDERAHQVEKKRESSSEIAPKAGGGKAGGSKTSRKAGSKASSRSKGEGNITATRSRDSREGLGMEAKGRMSGALSPIGCTADERSGGTQMMPPPPMPPHPSSGASMLAHAARGTPPPSESRKSSTPPVGSSEGGPFIGPDGHVYGSPPSQHDERQVFNSIRLLEDANWRIILEHGPLGDVVAVAAFAPGPVDGSTPNTPATPSGMAGGAMSSEVAFDMALAQNGMQQARVRSANSYNASNDIGGMGAAPERNLWVNANARCDGGFDGMTGMHGLGGGDERYAPPPRFAWNVTDPTSPTSPPPRRTVLPLRRNAPSALFTLLHVCGMRELDLYTRCHLCDLVALSSAAGVMILIISQIGMLLVHWCDVLPLHLAITSFSVIVCGWLNIVAFLQLGHVHRIFSSTGASLSPAPRVLSFADVPGQGGAMPPTNSRMVLDDATYSGSLPPSPPPSRGVAQSAIGAPRRLLPDLLPTHARGAPPSHHPPSRLPDFIAAPPQGKETNDPPVALTRPFQRSVNMSVLVGTVLLIITTLLLHVFDWFWLLILRGQPDALSHSLTSGSDGALWVLGVSGIDPLTLSQKVGWAVISFFSCAVISAALWAPLVLVVCVLEAHVHLAGQLCAMLEDICDSDDHSAAQLLMSVVPGHHALAETTSRYLGLYAFVHVLGFGYVALWSILGLAAEEAHPALLAAAITSSLAIYLLVAAFAGANWRRQRWLMSAAGAILRASRSNVSTRGLAAHQLVISELNASRGLTLLGLRPGKEVAPVLALALTVAIAVATQLGVEQTQMARQIVAGAASGSASD